MKIKRRKLLMNGSIIDGIGFLRGHEMMEFKALVLIFYVQTEKNIQPLLT